MRTIPLLLACIIILCSCNTNPYAECKIKGNVFSSAKGLLGVNITVFENDLLKQTEQISYVMECTTIDSLGNYECLINLRKERLSTNVIMIFENPEFTKAVCTLDIKQGRKEFLMDTIELFKSEHVANIAMDSLIIYPDSSLAAIKEKVSLDKYFIWEYTVHPPFDDTLMTDDGELHIANGRWVEIEYTMNAVNKKKGFIFYNPEVGYSESYKCFLAYIEPIQKCPIYQLPKEDPTKVLAKCKLDPKLTTQSAWRVVKSQYEEGGDKSFKWLKITNENCEGWVKGKKENVKTLAFEECG